MGTLVAGVAHEINNPLAALMSNAGAALEEVRAFQRTVDARTVPDRDAISDRSREVLEMLVDVESSARRIADIVRDLTILGRPDQAKEPVDLAAVVRDVLGRLPAAVTRRVTVRHELERVPLIPASPGQIEQVLSNLVGNAALSAPDGRRGEVVVRVHPGPEGMVRLEVSDDGPGIPPEIRERIFEPFFTTRPLGKGTGLGLSICNAIVGAHGGTMALANEPGRGATFTIDLPTANAGMSAPVA
jgi:signal transduction histidine kinase